MDVLACQGDLADEVADILVSPADTRLTMSGGAAASLRKSAGETLKTAVANHDRVEVGDAILTPTSELFADYVAHAVTKHEFESATEATVRAAVRTTLSLAVDKECESLVFPLLGSGVGGIRDETSVRIMLDEITAVDGLTEVRLITRSRREYRQTADLVDKLR